MSAVPRRTDDLYHYTSAGVALDSILPDARLRMGLAELMNDPRESRPQYPNFALAHGSPIGPIDQNPEWAFQEVDRMMRRSTKIACFTQDFELPSSVLDPAAWRGYAHPSLWAHYADNHTGVCLRFSQRALTASMQAALSTRGLLFEGEVVYARSNIAVALGVGLDTEQIYEFGLDAVISSYIERYHRELFFEKHSDWESEQEYRWVFVNPEPVPVYVDVSDAITGILLGDAFPSSRLDAVRHLASERDVPVEKVTFSNRHLHVWPLDDPPAREQWPQRRLGSLEKRVRELKHAEADAEAASAAGERLASPIVAQIGLLMDKIAARAGALPAVHVVVTETAAAIPESEQRKAPGVPTYVADYQEGRTCFVENQPRNGLTFIASAAVQAVADDRLKTHAAFELERRQKDTANERIELWRLADEGSSDAASTLADQLVKAMSEQLDPALATFEQMRSAL